MRSLFQQMKWHFIILNRNHLIAISAVLTLFYALVFFILKDWANLEYLLTILIYNDPALIGLIFMGVSLLLEKNEGVFPVWFVTPVNHHVYLLSRVLVLSIIGLACALGMAFAILGTAFYILPFSIGVFLTCMIFSLLGTILVTTTSDILLFVLRSIPILIFMSLPLLNYVHLTDIFVFEFWPIQGPLDLMVSAYEKHPSFVAIMLSFGKSLFWLLLIYGFTYRQFYTKIVKAG